MAKHRLFCAFANVLSQTENTWFVAEVLRRTFHDQHVNLEPSKWRPPCKTIDIAIQVAVHLRNAILRVSHARNHLPVVTLIGAFQERRGSNLPFTYSPHEKFDKGYCVANSKTSLSR
jgi:hypothetical protein